MVLTENFHVTDDELAEYVRQQSEAYEQEGRRRNVRSHFEARMLANIAKHPRHDTVPSPQTGRRAIGVREKKVRIYLQFPTTGDTISLRVHPELRLGPPEGKVEAVEEKAQEVTRRKTLMGTSSRVSRMKAKFWPTLRKKTEPPKCQAFSDLMNSMPPRSSPEPKDYRVMPSEMAMRHAPEEEDSLRDQIYRLTGLLPSEQRIFFNRCVLTVDSSNLRDYGIGHGDTLLVMQPLQCSPVYKGVKTKNKINLREMCPMNKPKKGFRFMPRWVTQQHPRLFEAEATAITNTAAEAIYTYDYSSIQDHGHTDFCGKIRRMHGIT